MRSTLPVANGLETLGFFQELTPAELDSLSDEVRVKEFRAATILYTPRDTGDKVFGLLDGHVDIYRLTLRGKRLVTRRVRPGGVFGETALLGRSPQGAFAEVVEDSVVCILTRELMLGIVARHPGVAQRVLLAMYSHVEQLEERLKHVSFSTVRVRLAHFLLTNMDPETGVVSGFTQADIGDTIGALRQTVTETLAALRDLGVVDVGHKRISVVGVKALRDMALE